MDLDALRQLVADNDSLQAIESLKGQFFDDKFLVNKLILIESDIKSIRGDYLQGLLTMEQKNVEINKQNLLVLEIINDIENDNQPSSGGSQPVEKETIEVPYMGKRVSNSYHSVFTLRLRKTQTDFFVVVSNQQGTGAAARYLAERLIDSSADYDWSLHYLSTGELLPTDFRFGTLKLKKEDILFLHGDKISLQKIINTFQRKPQDNDPAMLS